MNDLILILIVVAQFALIALLHYSMWSQKEKLKTWEKSLLKQGEAEHRAWLRLLDRMIENESKRTK